MVKNDLALLPGSLLTGQPESGENRTDHESKSWVWEGPLKDWQCVLAQFVLGRWPSEKDICLMILSRPYKAGELSGSLIYFLFLF
jgi:hypothetical protein